MKPTSFSYIVIVKICRFVKIWENYIAYEKSCKEFSGDQKLKVQSSKVQNENPQ